MKNHKNIIKAKNCTIFYTEELSKYLECCEGIIELNIGDHFSDNDENIYEVVYKIFNASGVFMIYDGKLI
jgi:hypothetical protein